jgi:hypothetical protein
MNSIVINSNLKFADEANLTEGSIRILNFFTSLYSLLYKFQVGILRSLIKVLFNILMCLIIPFVYPFLVFLVRKSNRLISELSNEIPGLTISELEQLIKVFQKLEVEKGLNIEMKSILIKSPFVLRPISYVLKENLDMLFELKVQIENQIENDLALFDEGLEADFPI